jgi:hypothetical protein
MATILSSATYLGYRATGSTVRFSFSTHDADGDNVAPNSAFESADLRIYKDGSATQRTSASGITMTSPFDTVTGAHHVDIDLSDNTDASFYAAGSFYEVWLVPDETVDGRAMSLVLAYFDIGVQAANTTQIAGSTVSTSTAQIGVNVIQAAGTAWGSSAITAASLAADAVAELADGVWDEAHAGHTTAGSFGNKFGAMQPAVLKLVLDAGSTTTAIVLDATTGVDAGAPSAVNDFYNGRVLVFTSGALAGQATAITDYVGATRTLTVTAVTGAPAAAVTAVIV